MRQIRSPEVMGFLYLTLPSVAGGPIPPVSPDLQPRYEALLDERPPHRTAVVVCCIIYAFLVAFAQGYRYGGRMGGPRTRVSDVLVFTQGCFTMAFVFSVGIFDAGLGLETDAQCSAVIRVCIILYAMAKFTLYMFLLELVHIVRAPFVERRQDPIFVLGGIIIVAGTVILLIWENINPISTLSRVNGICYIGIQRGAVIFLLTFDIAVNFILTVMFVWQLRPSNTAVHGPTPHLSPTSKRRLSRVLKPFQSKERPSTIRSKASQASLRRMIWRTIFGSTLVLIATTINCVMFISWRNSHMGHACLLLCLSDVVTGMLVSSFLTMRTGKTKNTTSRSAAETYSTTNSDKSPLNTFQSRRETLTSFTQDDDLLFHVHEPAPAAKLPSNNETTLTRSLTR